MVLAQQINPEALRRGSPGGLLGEVCGILEDLPGGLGGPSIFRVSSAVAAMFARIDWPRLRRSTGGEIAF